MVVLVWCSGFGVWDTVCLLVRNLACCVLGFRCFGSWIGFAGLVCCCYWISVCGV